MKSNKISQKIVFNEKNLNSDYINIEIKNLIEQINKILTDINVRVEKIEKKLESLQ